jgi:3-deoxy-manno-octulosonate cytidylyltransferase (CMP-KDO synthetase)
LRAHKQSNPHSGTTAVIDGNNRALWFSKQILPAIRKEKGLRETDTLSPVLRHIGLYAYRSEALERFVTLPESRYEALEGLEQLRMLENGMNIYVAPLRNIGAWALGGIDTPEDLVRANAYLTGRA